MQRSDVTTVKDDLTCADWQRAGDQIEKRALAGTVRSDQRVNTPFFKG